MYQHILVAVDDSETSKLAVQEAIRLAKDANSQLRLVHVLDEGVIYWGAGGMIMDTVFDVLRKVGQAVLDQGVTAVRAAGLETETVLKETVGQRVADVIVDEAKRWPADLLVIGTHGRRGMDHLLIGSVAEGVMRKSSMPVLLIRGQPKTATSA